MTNLTPERLDRIKQVAARRQKGLTILLENVHDPHNIGAVMRSCDAVGIHEIFVLYTEPQLTDERLIMGKRSSAGTRKWVDIHYYRQREACFQAIRSSYPTILSAVLAPGAEKLWSLDLTKPTALLFGNERDGISDESVRLSDGAFYIPMAGMAQSLNISVACAVTLFEAYRQRDRLGYYSLEDTGEDPLRSALLESYLDRQDSSSFGQVISPKDADSPMM